MLDDVAIMQIGEVRPPWVIVGSSTGVSARNAESGQRLDFAGDFPSLEVVFRYANSLSALNGEFLDFLTIRDVVPLPLTVGNVLGPTGFGILFLELTGQCNERCTHCYASSSPQVTTELSWDEVEDVIRSAKTLGVRTLQFIGGDPLISRHLRGAVELAVAQEIPRLEIFTNGLALSEDLAKWLAARKVEFAFSLYSASPEKHDAVTNTPDSHRRTLRAISLARSQGAPVRVGVVLKDATEDDVAAMFSQLSELGVPREKVSVDVVRSVGRGSWQPSEGEVRAVTNFGHAGRHSSSGKLCVTYGGDVVPCIFDRKTVLGTVRKTSLLDVLETPLQLQYRPKNLLDSEPMLACHPCRTKHELLQNWRRT